MLRLLYRAAWWLIAPAAVLRLLWRSRREPGYRYHVAERFGRIDLRRDARRALIWVHAVSVGETRAAEPLVRALLAAHPECDLLLTHMTPSGRATGEALFGDAVLRCYLPYDTPGAVGRFLVKARPTVGVLMETEVWPTLIECCAARRMPLILANARMSARSAARASRFGRATLTVFGGLADVYAQSEADAARFRALGVASPRVFGNLKFDIAPSPRLLMLGEAWRAAFGDRPVWVAASTRDGEEALVLEAFDRLQAARPDALLVLVPRHPQRFDEVARLAQTRWRVARRSQWRDGAPVDPSTQVWLGDSMGEMTAYYACARLAFIGGSLVPTGGQNLIESCAAGTPVLFGPSMFNFSRASADALAAGAAVQVADSAALGEALIGLLEDRARRDAMAAAARDFAAAHRGATERTVAALAQWLPERSGSPARAR
ncbi:lipid IV(A) 3-deoxy-D-manno-octulosonic acid transferase [Chitinasiproducens palmae]|uniref:3-deoxy-D-manno-octulosonic acid transferase n=1 Tax=Chitinasiproducens palmae TaxID=1770053 RepID=A0A1H2PNP0_9BURK|nr:lipid IV(A) 3-deoxy-D-manno-octulosonic acid transferase [Chitinasiproducens palmae]SDV47805.1 3-deoxy-D-manno-octulosonic-acid transferase [Chitinasiproducens palmae]